jgi:protocatechuate 3,4-dioxygenase beta subunit
MFKLRQKRVKTFYPGVIEEAQAKQVQVNAGSEATGIDIQFSLAEAGFAVSGRVVDAEKGTPVPNVMVRYDKASKAPTGRADPEERDTGELISETLGNMGFGMTTTNNKGEFQFKSVAPGSYKLEAQQIGAITGVGTSEFFGDSVSFEVRGANVDKLEVKMHRGASISGVVVFDDADGQSGLQSLGRLMLSASVMDSQTNSHSSGTATVAEDGTFRIGGLKPGRVTIRPFSIGEQKAALLRIERNGVELQGGLDIQANEQVTGIRVVLTSGNCVIRGHVTIQGGSPPSSGMLRVTARPFNGDPNAVSYSESGEVDSKGDFEIEGLAPGIYEVQVFVLSPARGGMRNISAKQTVTVSKTAPAYVELVLDLSRKDSDK